MEYSSKGALSPLMRKPLYEQLVEHLRAYIVEAGLSAGERLPAERELAEMMGVSRATIRQAIVALDVQGIVEVRHGEGIFLRVDRLDFTPIAQLVELQRRLPDILDAREALEVKLAELAAERRTDTDLTAIDAALEKMADEIKTGKIGEGGDQAFHESVMRAARSEIIGHMYAVIADDIAASRHESLSEVDRPLASLAQHRRIGAAIRDLDTVGAAQAMRDHLMTVRAVKLLTWTPAGA